MEGAVGRARAYLLVLGDEAAAAERAHARQQRGRRLARAAAAALLVRQPRRRLARRPRAAGYTRTTFVNIIYCNTTLLLLTFYIIKDIGFFKTTHIRVYLRKYHMKKQYNFKMHALTNLNEWDLSNPIT